MEDKKKPTDIIKLDPIPELTSATEGLNNINSLADNILTTVSSWKQMERDMHQMDVQFNASDNQCRITDRQEIMTQYFRMGCSSNIHFCCRQLSK